MAFAFAIELWSEDRTAVEELLAETATGQSAYAAFHAALKHYPNRYITLRRDEAVIARSERPVSHAD